MQLNSKTAEIQGSFADYCRGIEGSHIPEADKKCAEVYPVLVRNIINSTLSRAYPITKVVLSDSEWDLLIQAFIKLGTFQSPLLWQMPEGLVKFIQQNKYAARFNKPYLDDLILFEWNEIEVHMMPDINTARYAEVGDLRSDPLILNQEYKILNLKYNVFSPSKTKPFAEPGNYFLLVYRHPDTLNVNFIELSLLYVSYIKELYLNMDQFRSGASDQQELNWFLELLLKERMILGFQVMEGNIC